VVRKRQIDQWCKSSSTFRFVPAKRKINHEEISVKKMHAELARLEAQKAGLQAHLKVDTRLLRQGRKATEPQKRPCPQPVPRWEQQATHMAQQVTQDDRIPWKQIEEEVDHQVRRHLQE